MKPVHAGVVPATAPATGVRHALRAFRHRDFTVFWCGALTSNIGTWIQNLAVPYALYQITRSALWVGLATFAQFIPAMGLGPLAGSIADRHDRRRVLLLTQGAQCLAAVALWVAWLGGVRSPTAILLLVAVSGTFQGLNVPSWQSFVNDLVPRGDLLSAITLNSLQFNAARAIGPGIGGLVLATLGPTWAFFLNAISFASVLAALALVRTRVPAMGVPGSVMQQFRAAVRYVRDQPGIQVAILVAVLAGMLGNPIVQFTVVFAADVFEVGPIALSALNVALGVGAVVVAPVVSGWDSVLSRADVTRWSMLGYGLAVVAFATAPTYPVALVAMTLVGGAFLAVISTTNTAVQVIVADHVRGRVLGLRTVVFTGAYPLGALVQGAAADVFGPRVTVATAGGLLALAAAVLAMRPAWLRRLDDPHDEHRPDLEAPEPEPEAA